MTYPKPCRNCARILRPATATQDDYPTSQTTHQAKGLCGACYRTPHRTQPRTYPSPCESCHRLMRPKTADPDKCPTAEIGHHAHGLCRTCYGPYYRGGKPNRDEIITRTKYDQIRHENNVAGLNRFMQARYERIIRARRSRV